MHRRWMAVPTAVLALSSLAACGSESAPSASECSAPAEHLVSALQRYVDEFADVAAKDLASEAIRPDTGGLQEAVARYRSGVEELVDDCGRDDLQDTLVDELAGLRGGGALAETIAARLRDGFAGDMRFGDAGRLRIDQRLEPGDDLAGAVAAATPDSTITLTAGEYEVSGPMIVLDGVTIEGAGVERTHIRTSSAGVGILYIGPGQFGLRALTIEHVGDDPATVLMMRGGTYELEDVRVTGARTNDEGAGGVGLLSAVAEGGGEGAARVSRARFDGNASAGVTVTGADEPVFSELQVVDNGGCGVCYLGDAGGTLSDSTVRGNVIGVAVFGNAAPRVERNVIAGNEIGLQAGDRADPTIAANDFTDLGDAGMVFGGQASGSARENVCLEDEVSVLVLEESTPDLDDSCRKLDLRDGQLDLEELIGETPGS